jgi:hypothetical protein
MVPLLSARRPAGCATSRTAEPLDGQGKIFAAIAEFTAEGLAILPRSFVMLLTGLDGVAVTARSDPDQKMLQAALRGDAEAAAALTRAAADLVWSACVRVTRARAETEEAFRDVMTELRADGFARLKVMTGAHACAST